jgi:hypothetical protein
MIITFSIPVSQPQIIIYTSNGLKLNEWFVNSDIFEIDMSKFASGVYLVQILSNDVIILTRKIIK